MSATPLGFDPVALTMSTADGGQVPLSAVERLWLVDVVFPGMPDEHEQRWVLQLPTEIVLAPGLSLPTRAHVGVLAQWVDEHASLFVLQRTGWPWAWGTTAWAWRAMRQQGGRFGRDVWQQIVASSHVKGPVALSLALASA